MFLNFVYRKISKSSDIFHLSDILCAGMLDEDDYWNDSKVRSSARLHFFDGPLNEDPDFSSPFLDAEEEPETGAELLTIRGPSISSVNQGTAQVASALKSSVASFSSGIKNLANEANLKAHSQQKPEVNESWNSRKANIQF